MPLNSIIDSVVKFISSFHCIQRLFGSNNPSLPKTPAHSLTRLALPTREQLDSCCPSRDGLGWEGDSSVILHIPNVPLFTQPQETFWDHYIQVFSSQMWAVLLKARKPNCQVFPLWQVERRALPWPLSSCWGQAAPAPQQPEQEQNFALRVCLVLEQRQGHKSYGLQGTGEAWRPLQTELLLCPPDTRGLHMCHLSRQRLSLLSFWKLCLFSCPADPTATFAAAAGSSLAPDTPPGSTGPGGQHGTGEAEAEIYLAPPSKHGHKHPDPGGWILCKPDVPIVKSRYLSFTSFKGQKKKCKSKYVHDQK